MSFDSSWFYVFGAVGGYLIGSFPTGVVISKLKYRIDVREIGSGNIGATNVTRVFGWYAGFLTLGVDFLKGLLPVLLLKPYYAGNPWLVTVVGGSVVFGHCYSIFLRFRGGKGVATSFGVLSVVVPAAALLALVVYVVALLLTKISAVGSLAGVLSTVVYVGVVRPVLPIAVLILAFSLIVIVRHRSNIERLIKGTPPSA